METVAVTEIMGMVLPITKVFGLLVAFEENVLNEFIK